MPTIPSLLGSYIDETYPRLVQVSGSSFADGLGNPITFGTTPTGSFLITASVSSNTITFTKGDGSTFPITVNTGSGGGSPFPYTGSARITGSLIITGSTTSTLGFTGSLQGTASWATNAITSSYPIAVTGSMLYSTSPAANGILANNANSIFLGSQAGFQVTDAYTSNFFGLSAGYSASYANLSNFLGVQAGQNATNASGSNFLGENTGINATNAAYSNFIGTRAGGFGATSASFSNFIGYKTGFNRNTPGFIGSNNIIIGTNISLPVGRQDSINIGGIIFGTGSNSNIGTTSSDAITGSANGRIGINVVTPLYTLDVSGSGNYTNGLTVTGSLSAPTITGSLQGTASWATNFVSASNYVLNSQTSSFVQNSQTSSFVQNSQTSSFVTNSQTGSFATTGSNSFKANQTITGSLLVTGSITITGSFTQNTSTASFGGLVGIGTTSPTAKLDVNGSGNFTLGVTGYLKLIDSIGGYPTHLQASYGNSLLANNAIFDGSNWKYSTNGAASMLQMEPTIGQFIFNTAGAGFAGDIPSFIETIRLRDGKVGIGTSNPVSKLHVSGTTTITGDWNANSTRGLHFSFRDNNYGAIYAIENGVSWRPLAIDSSEINLNGNSSGTIRMPNLTNATQTNVVSVNTSTGQLYYQNTIPTSSYAYTASFVKNAVSSSYALTASYAATYSFVTVEVQVQPYISSSNVDGPYGFNSILTASYAEYAATVFPYTGNAGITGSLLVSEHLEVSLGSIVPYYTVTGIDLSAATYDITGSGIFEIVNASGNITFPDPSTHDGQTIFVVNTDSSKFAPIDNTNTYAPYIAGTNTQLSAIGGEDMYHFISIGSKWRGIKSGK